MTKALTTALACALLTTSYAQIKLAKPTAPKNTAGVAASPSPYYQASRTQKNNTGKAYAAASLGFGSGAGSNSQAGLGFSLSGGYHLSPSLAIAASMARLPTASNIGSKKVGSSYIWALSAVLFRPLEPRLHLFGKAGLADVYNNVNVDGSNSTGGNFAAYLGAGVAYQYRPSLQLTAEGLATIGSKSAANSVAVLAGISYQFNLK